MRHQKISQRLGRQQGARRATLRSLAIALFKYQRIKTTKIKARLAQSLAERLISLGRINTLHSRRQALKILNDKHIVGLVFGQIAPLFKERTSGFCRVIPAAFNRKGDGAEMAYLELTEKLLKVKPEKAEKEKAPKEARPSEAKEKLKAQPEIKPKEKIKFPKEAPQPTKKLKPKQFLGGLRSLFKKERDSL